MIYINDKEITAVYKAKKTISVIYMNGLVLWQAIRSCFGAGFWNNDKPWVNDEGWKNNK